MIKRALTLVNAMNIIASVFVNDDAGPWAGCTTAPAKCPEQSRGTVPTPQEAGKGICFPLQVVGRDAQRWWRSAAAASTARLRVRPSSRRGLAEAFGTWERIFQGQADWLARES